MMRAALVKGARACCPALVLCIAPFVTSAAQNCGTGGGGNQTKFHSTSGPLTVATPTVTATDYAAGQSQLSQTVTLRGCCGGQGSGNRCIARIALGSVGAPNLASLSWRVVSVTGARCSVASPAVALNTDYAVTAGTKEIFRMSNPGNGGAFCTAVIQVRGTGLSYTGHQSGNTYSRGINLTIVKTS